MTAALFPYPTVGDAEPTLTVTAIRLDGELRSNLLKKDELTVSIFEEQRPWTRVEMDLEVTCDPERLKAFESENGQVLAVAVANCRSTNTRQPVVLTRSDVDVARWSGSIEFDRDNVRDRVDLITSLSATVKEVRHRPVATTPVWTVYMDEPESLRIKGSIRVRWVRFSEESPPACDFKKSTHIVSFSGGVPELWLNADFDGLDTLLKDRKERRGVDKALHDFQRTSIARSAWMTLIADAMSAVRAGADEEGSQPEWPEVPWQAEVLKLVLHAVEPGRSDRELLSMAVSQWSRSPGSGDFFARAEAVVGDLVKANEMLRRFVKNYQEGDL